MPQSAHALFSRRRLYPKAAIAAALPLLPPGGQANALRSFPKKKRNNLLPFFHALLACRSFCIALPASSSRVPPTTHPRPVHLRPSHKQKNAGPQHCAANPLATFVKRAQKKRRLLAQENTRRHAWLTRSCCGRKNLFIDGPHSLLPFFLSPFLQGKEKRKQKQIQQVRIHRSDSLRSSSRCTRLARRASSAKIYVAFATRFVRDCVEDLAPLAASMERIPKCSWHIKDQCSGVIKASRTFSYFCVFFLPQNLSPKKFDFSQKI